MSTIIHVELDVLCFLILAVIRHQVRTSVSQQLNRVLFRLLADGIMVSLALDIIWVLIEGKAFPGAVALNKTVNALYLGLGVILGGIWYLYVLETMNYRITRKVVCAVIAPGAVFLALNLLSIRTGWIFTVSPENVYSHGPMFWLQDIGALAMLFISLIHILIRLLNRKAEPSDRAVGRLLLFYILPVIATMVSLLYTGLPGTWTCAAVSIMLIYMDDQDREITRDSLTGLNNRKTLDNVFAEYTRQAGEERQLYLFMMDLDGFKQINDTYGHAVGDRALVRTAELLTAATAGMKAFIARFGGDEFMIMTFFGSDGEAEAFRQALTGSFAGDSEKEKLPCPLMISAGYSRWQPGESLAELEERADGELYQEKKRKNVKR